MFAVTTEVLRTSPSTGQASTNPLLRHQGWVWSAAYGTDGSRILCAGQDGTVRQWPPGWSEPIGLICRSLRTHQSLLNPTSETEKEAKSTCQRWGWR